MSDFDKFNPSVPEVSPGNYNVTKPIDQPKANTALGGLFDEAGKGLKDVGEIVKDTDKVVDYTNKQDIANRSIAALDAERQGHTARLESLNVMSGTDPSMLEDPGAASALKGLAKRAETLATAKADEGQLDIYYKARVDTLAKQYRAAYPQYRDYIDKVFEKAGFGNPANEYVKSLQSQYLKNQAAMGAKDTQANSIVDKGMSEFGHPFDKLATDLRSGVPGTPDRIFQEYAARTSVKSSMEYQQKVFEMSKSVGESRKDAIEKLTTDTGQKLMGTELNSKSTPDSLGSVMDRVQGYMERPETIQEDAVLHDVSVLDSHIARIRNTMVQQGNQPRNYIDPKTGDTVSYTNRQLMTGSAYDASVENTLSGLKQIRESLTNQNYGAAKFNSNLVAGWATDYAKHIYSQPNLAATLHMMDFLKNYPEASREFLKGVAADPNRVGIPAALQGASDSWALRFVTPDPGSAKQALDTMGKEVNNPEANNFILNQTEHILNQKIDPKLRNNAVKAFFGPDNFGITKGMSADKRAGYFAKVTDPKYIEAIKGLGTEAVQLHKSWVDNEFSQVLLPRELSSLPYLGQAQGSQLKLHYNDETNQFGVDYGKNKNVNRWPNSAVEKLGEAARVELFHANGIVNRVNQGIGGVANVATASGGDPTAYIIKSIQATGNTNNYFWEAVRGQAHKYEKPIGPEKPTLGSSAAP